MSETCTEVDKVASICSETTDNMPENKYQNTKIYKIIDTQNPEVCYVGHTTSRLLSTRLRQHRGNHIKFKKSGVKDKWCSSFLILDAGEDSQILLVENFPCYSIDEARSREAYWIERLETVNRRMPGRTAQEWRDGRKEEKKIYDAQYYLDHKETKSEKSRKHYRENSKEILARGREKVQCGTCGRMVCRYGMSSHKKSRTHSCPSLATEETSQC